MKRVLVTGAGGFIGTRALPALRRRGFEVHAVGRRHGSDERVRWHTADLLDDGARRAVVAEVGPSHLLHLAWCAEHGRFWEARENADWVAATVRLVEEFAASGGERAVCAGSCAEYDWATGGLCSEATTPLRPATFYGACKDATRRVVERAEVAVAWGRVFFLYGPGEHPARLVAAVARALVAGERAPTSAGAQRRDFLHVDDVADAFAALVASDVEGPVNVGSGEGVAIRAVVEQIARAAGRSDLLDVAALEQRPGEPAELVADVTRLREQLCWAPEVRLGEGLAQTVAWWRDRVR